MYRSPHFRISPIQTLGIDPLDLETNMPGPGSLSRDETALACSHTDLVLYHLKSKNTLWLLREAKSQQLVSCPCSPTHVLTASQSAAHECVNS